METPFTYTIVYRVSTIDSHEDFEFLAHALAQFDRIDGSAKIEQVTVKKLFVLSK